MKNHEPKSFIQGESLEWTRQFGTNGALVDFTITYYFRGAGKGFDAVGTTENFDDFIFRVSSEATGQMQPGEYSFQAVADNGTEKVLCASGTVKVKPGLAASSIETFFDGRSENRKILDAIRAMIAKKATLDQQEYAIGNRQLKRIPITELIALESRYVGLVARENEAERLRKGGKLFKKVLIRLK